MGNESTEALVSVLITAHNRPLELERTLAELRKQDYGTLELIVIDDASAESLADVVHACWPTAVFIRNEVNRGLIASRTAGMCLATGRYIVSLDDDSCFIQRDAINRAVARMEREPQIGILAFHKVDAPQLPAELFTPTEEKYVHVYHGCAHMMRSEMVRSIGGYCDFFYYYAEEAEYSVRAVGEGWRILMPAGITVHHRVSPIGRSVGRIRAYSFRNSVWSTILRTPLRRVPLELAWKVLQYSAYVLRTGDGRRALWAVTSMVGALPMVMRRRRPISITALRQYDRLRLQSPSSFDREQLTKPLSMRERARWLTSRASGS
jgi:GT2 family glycosyltransferase